MKNKTIIPTKKVKPLTEKEILSKESEKFLRKVIPKYSKVYTLCRHVSKSGMSRQIQVFVVKKPKFDKKHQILNITKSVANFLDYKVRNYSLVVNGCGMDMGFSVVYDLSSRLYADGYNLKQEWL